MRTNKPNQSSLEPDPSAVEISDKLFDELTELAVDMAEECCLGRHSVPPAVIVYHRQIVENNALSDIEATYVVIDEDFNDPDRKRDIMRTVGKQFYETKKVPAAVFMLSEAWMSKNKDPNTIPSQDPNRQEAIAIVGRTIGRECKSMVMIPVSRDKEDRMIRNGENDSVKDCRIDMPLLDQFFIGFFHKHLPAS